MLFSVLISEGQSGILAQVLHICHQIIQRNDHAGFHCTVQVVEDLRISYRGAEVHDVIQVIAGKLGCQELIVGAGLRGGISQTGIHSQIDADAQLFLNVFCYRILLKTSVFGLVADTHGQCYHVILILICQSRYAHGCQHGCCQCKRNGCSHSLLHSFSSNLS